MRTLLIIFVAAAFLSAQTQTSWPDLYQKSDLEALGKGKIFEIDQTTYSRIELFEVKEYYIVYIKSESLHDMAFDRISKIEFPGTKWGNIRIEFKDKKPKFSRY